MTDQKPSNGGVAVVKKYGSEYMRELGRKGAQATHSKYKIVPWGTSKFRYVDRETNQPVGKPWS